MKRLISPYFLFFIVLFNVSLTSDAIGCVLDLTDQSQANRRSELFNNLDNPGVRLAWSGMKEMNKLFGLGGVNAVIASHENTICESFESNEFRQSHPDIKVEVAKTDFKGYYLTCTPLPSCVSTVAEQLNKIEPPTFPETRIKFNTISTDAGSYQEGYVKTRVISEYPNFRPPLHEFIENEMNEAIKLARASHPNMAEDEFRNLIAKNAERYRSEGLSSVDDAFKRLVVGLDTLLETPFVGANNIENELLKALNHVGEVNRDGYQVASAITGDDLFIIVKRDGEVVKVIGSDARGLGVTNMLTRYIEYGEQVSSGRIGSMSDVFALSLRAIHRADANMDESLNSYFRLVQEELRKAEWKNVDEMIEAAHHRYHVMVEEGADLMVIRSGSIDICGTDQACLMNKVTALHNRLKSLEKLGVDLSYGASCLAIEYTLFLNGLK